MNFSLPYLMRMNFNGYATNETSNIIMITVQKNHDRSTRCKKENIFLPFKINIARTLLVRCLCFINMCNSSTKTDAGYRSFVRSFVTFF